MKKLNLKYLPRFAKKHLHNILYKKANTRSAFTVLGLALKEFRMSFRQFFAVSFPFSSFLRAIKYQTFAILRLFLGRSVRLNYGFTGEDRIIESLLKPRVTYNGFYVDVGCNDPRFISNTFLLYRRGWRGICIDANQKLINKFKKIRPRDIAICALVSNSCRMEEFVEFTNNINSSIEKKHIYEWTNSGQTIERKQIMETSTLTDILDKNKAPANFDLLCIDVEEHDWFVLQSLDFKKYQPRLIVIESDDFDPSLPEKNIIYNFLNQRNYIFRGSILSNLYFMRD